MKKLVVVPTYNEKENIQKLIPELLKLEENFDVLVVDDSSPDGTSDIVREFQKSESRIHLLLRPGKQGLAKAYIGGFKWGLENGYEALCEMDADFSHRPQDLVTLLQEIENQDFVVGSRYVPGGETVNWGLARKVISRGGSLYARTILGYPLNDWTGGFNIWRKEVLQAIDLDTIQSEGYSFQIELKYRALKNGLSGVEKPIVFEDRRVGESKMSLRIVLEAFYRVWMIRFV